MQNSNQHVVVHCVIRYIWLYYYYFLLLCYCHLLYIIWQKERKAEQSSFWTVFCEYICTKGGRDAEGVHSSQLFMCNVQSGTDPQRVFFISQAQRFALGAASNQPAMTPPSFSSASLQTNTFNILLYLQACGGDSSSERHKWWNVCWLV